MKILPNFNPNASQDSNTTDRTARNTSNSALAQADATNAPHAGRATANAANDNRAPTADERLGQTTRSESPAARSTTNTSSDTQEAVAMEFLDLMGRLATTMETPAENNADAITNLSNDLFEFGEKHLSARASNNRDIALQAQTASIKVHDPETKALLQALCQNLTHGAAGIDRMISAMHKIADNQKRALQIPEPKEGQDPTIYANAQMALFKESMALQLDADRMRREQAPRDIQTLDTIQKLEEKTGSTTVAGIDLSGLKQEFTAMVQQHQFMAMVEGLANQLEQLSTNNSAENQRRAS